MKVKISGAGSAGIHLAQACSRMGWGVSVVDTSESALRRFRDIYSERYNVTDFTIGLYFLDKRGIASQFESLRTRDQIPDRFDIIMIATPPDVRMKLALEVIKENPKLLHLEKPLCAPDLKGVAEFEAEMKNHPDTIVTVGYDHAVSESITRVRSLLNENRIEEKKGDSGEFGEIITIDVEFREHWQGALNAHPWLNGLQNSYLGYWRRGGGAGCEHSHALHLFLKLASWSWWWPETNYGVCNSKCEMSMDGPNGLEYDRIAHFLIEMKNGKIGRVTQDVVTSPPKKWARMQGTKGWLEWHCNGDPTGDVIKYETETRSAIEIFPKKRQDDFFYEIRHYAALLGAEKPCESPLSYRSGREVMDILNKAYYG